MSLVKLKRRGLKRNNKSVGTIGEQAVILEFARLGIQVFTPIGDNCPVDLVADFNRKLNKIQVKTSINSEEKSYSCHLISNYYHVNKSGYRKYTADEVDYFAIYNLSRKIPLLIPFPDVENKKQITIRFEEKGNNGNQIFKEEDYLFEKITGSSFTYFAGEKRGKSKKRCVDCGKYINLGSLRCTDCEKKHKKEICYEKLNQIVSRENLKKKVRNQSFESIGREFQVTGNTIKKWCKKYNLPSKKEDINSISEEDWNNI